MIYEPVTDPDSVKDCYNTLREAMGCSAGENDDAVWDEDRKLNISFYVTRDVYRVSLAPKERQSGVFQVNAGKQTPRGGEGLYVSDENGRRFLTHTGRFKGGLPKGHAYGDSDADDVHSRFREHTDSSRWITVQGEDNRRYLVAPIDANRSEIRDQLSKALSEVASFKDLKQKKADDSPSTGDGAKQSKQPASRTLNTILFGPPGTGKTYRTIERCVEICDGSTPNGQVRERYDELVQQGRVRFITFHQSYGYEEFVEGIRPKAEAGQISYGVEDGMFKKMAHAAKASPSTVLGSFRPRFDDVWAKLHEYAARQKPVVQTKKGRKEYTLTRRRDSIILVPRLGGVERMGFERNARVLWDSDYHVEPLAATPRQIEGIVGDRKDASHLWIIYKEMWQLAYAATPQNFVLVIDEINRANISNVMGELITLLEEDKREGAANEITVTLPYSGDTFKLPANLHILGTMNTADRSIALLDTALRRRFRFEEMPPQPDLLEAVDGVDLPSVIAAINKRLEYLVDRDHLIGHAWFINAKTRADIDDVMRHKVIPLIAEYFYDDWSKVWAVLGGTDHFVKSDRLDPPPGLDATGEDRYSWTVQAEFAEDAYERLVAGRRSDGGE